MLFISHRSADRDFATDLLRRAEQHGYDLRQIFLDVDPGSGIPVGADWQQVLYEKLKRQRALIVVYSSHWGEGDSKWCFAELVTAKALGKPVFPVVVEDVPLDPMVGDRQAVWPCREGEAAYARLWKSLKDCDLGPYDTRPWPPLDDDGKPGDPCPYPGLTAFSERYAPVYFGRDPETYELLAKLNNMRERGEPRMLMIVGGSGSGKSSLLRAGVLPRLARNGDWLVLPTLRYGQSSNDELTLLGLLAQQLAARFPKGSGVRPDWKALREKFESDDFQQAARSFFEATQDLNIALDRSDATTLLSIDQFEEFLTTSARPSALRFLQFLHALLPLNNGRLLVIGTLRSDYLDIYERHRSAIERPFFESYRLAPFPWDRVSDVIVQPAARVEVAFDTEVIERLKRDAPDGDALPLLAFVLEKLFRRCAVNRKVTISDYGEVGGIKGAIELAVKRIVPPELPEDVEQALRLSFVRDLVQLNEKDEFVRRAAKWSALPAVAKPLLTTFITERLLHTSESVNAGDATIEVSHEALFRCWPALAKWLAVSSGVLRWRRDVERDRRSYGSAWSGLTAEQLAISRDWPRSIADELSPEEVDWIAKAVRKERWFRAGIATVGLVITLLACAAYWQTTIAREQTRTAERAADDLKTKEKLSTSLRLAALSEATKSDRLPLKLLLAVEAMLHSETREARHSLQRALETRPEVDRYHFLRGMAPAFRMASMPDGVIAAASENAVMLLKGATSAMLAVPEGAVSKVALGPDGRIAAGFARLSASGEQLNTGGVVVFEADGSRARAGILDVAEGFVRTVAFGPDGRIAASYHVRRNGADPFEPMKGGVVVFDTSGPRVERKVFAVSEGEVTDVAVGTAGRVAVSYSSSGLGIGRRDIVLFDADGSRKPGAPITFRDFNVNSVAFASDGRLFAGLSRQAGGFQLGGVGVFDAGGNGKRPVFRVLDVPEGGVSSVAIGPGGQVAAGFIIGKGGEGVALFNPDGSRASTSVIEVPEGQVMNVGFSAGGRIVVGYSTRVSGGGTFTGDGGIMVLDPAGARLRKDVLASGNSWVRSVKFGSRGRLALLTDAGVELFNVDGSRLSATPLAIPEGDATSFDIDLDGRIVLGLRLGNAGAILEFNPDGTRVQAGIRMIPEGEVRSVAFGLSGRIAAAFAHEKDGGVLGGGVVVFGARDERVQRAVFTASSGDVVDVAFLAEGRFAAAIRPEYGKCDVVVFDTGTEGRRLVPLVSLDGDPQSIAVGAKGRIAVGLRADVMGGQGNRLAVIDGLGGKQTARSFEVPEGWVNGVAFGRGGQIATGIGTNSKRPTGLVIFDADGDRILSEPLSLAEASMTSVAYAPDGRIAVGRSDGKASIFDVDLESWKRKAILAANRNLTRQEWSQYFPATPYRRTIRSLSWPHDITEDERRSSEAIEANNPASGVTF